MFFKRFVTTTYFDQVRLIIIFEPVPPMSLHFISIRHCLNYKWSSPSLSAIIQINKRFYLRVVTDNSRRPIENQALLLNWLILG